MNLQELATRVGAWCWVERRLFEVVGGWVGSEADTEAKLLFAAHSHHHAWHGDMLARCLPGAYVPPSEELVVPPAEAPVFERMASLASTVERLAGLFGVIVPAKVAAYRSLTCSGNATTEGPLLRAVRIIESDELGDWADGQRVLRGRVRGTSDVNRAAQTMTELEKGLVKAHLRGNPIAAFGR